LNFWEENKDEKTMSSLPFNPLKKEDMGKVFE
jgi:hypothetical protein